MCSSAPKAMNEVDDPQTTSQPAQTGGGVASTGPLGTASNRRVVTGMACRR